MNSGKTLNSYPHLIQHKVKGNNRWWNVEIGRNNACKSHHYPVIFCI